MSRIVKGEPSTNGVASSRRNDKAGNAGREAAAGTSGSGGGVERRVLRSRYLAVKNLINGLYYMFSQLGLKISHSYFIFLILNLGKSKKSEPTVNFFY